MSSIFYLLNCLYNLIIRFFVDINGYKFMEMSLTVLISGFPSCAAPSVARAMNNKEIIQYEDNRERTPGKFLLSFPGRRA